MKMIAGKPHVSCTEKSMDIWCISYKNAFRVEYKGQFTVFFSDRKSILKCLEVIGFLFCVCGVDWFFVLCIGGY